MELFQTPCLVPQDPHILPCLCTQGKSQKYVGKGADEHPAPGWSPSTVLCSWLVLGNPSAPSMFPSLSTRAIDPKFPTTPWPLPTYPRLCRGSKRRGDCKAEQKLASEKQKEEVSTLEPATGFLLCQGCLATGLTGMCNS